MTREECEKMCKRNCLCTAYPTTNISGSGCLLWFGGLIDIRTFPENTGDTVYIRMSSSQLGKLKKKQ
ncbi:putative non-specific serine/threonine protein kinase [Helianthus anomalus]